MCVCQDGRTFLFAAEALAQSFPSFFMISCCVRFGWLFFRVFRRSLQKKRYAERDRIGPPRARFAAFFSRFSRRTRFDGGGLACFSTGSCFHSSFFFLYALSVFAACFKYFALLAFLSESFFQFAPAIFERSPNVLSGNWFLSAARCATLHSMNALVGRFGGGTRPSSTAMAVTARLRGICGCGVVVG